MNKEALRIILLLLAGLLCTLHCTNGSGRGPVGGDPSRDRPSSSPKRIAPNVGPAGQEPRAAVHPSPIAGSWYPRDPETLRRILEGYLADAPPVDPGQAASLIAVIVPHAGYAYSGRTAAYAYKMIGSRRPRRILMLGPSHYTTFRGVSLADYDAYETPLGRIPVDPSARELLKTCPVVRFHEDAHRKEHSLDIQVPFLQVLFPDAPPSIVPLLVGYLEEGDYPVLARCLQPLLDDDTVILASSDFTHYGPRYGYVPFPSDGGVSDRIRSLDEGAWKQILALDRRGFLSYRDRTGITICGYRPIALLLELLPRDTQAKKLSYSTSGMSTGDYENSVSYYALAFLRKALWGREDTSNPSSPVGGKTMTGGEDKPQGSRNTPNLLSPAERSTLLRLARDTLEGYVREGRKPDPESGRYELTPALRQHRGAFVTLKEGGTLRGCIGYIQPIEPLYKTVVENTINAATRDFRFPPVQPAELPSIEIEISALTPPEPVASYRDIVLGRHGIVLKKGGRQAVFLPQVAPEQGWDLPETLRHLSLKAGLPSDAWRDPEAQFFVFTAEVFHEKEHGGS